MKRIFDISIYRCVFALLFLGSTSSSRVLAKRIGEENNSNANDGESRNMRRTQSVSGGFDLQLAFELIDYSCFSSHTTVDVFGKGNEVTIDKVQVGDRILTGSGGYETVYSIDHRHPSKSTTFLQIHTSELVDNPLELTEKHMIFLEGKSNPVIANSIQVGDQLKTIEVGGPRSGIVTKIETVTRNGIFNPLTADGTIVANGGIVASSYSAVFEDDEYINIAGVKVMPQQTFFNIILKPYRYMCTGISLELCKTGNELVGYGQLGRVCYHIWTQQRPIIQTVTLAIFMVIIYCVDLIMNPFSLVLGTIALIYPYIMNMKALKKKKNC